MLGNMHQSFRFLKRGTANVNNYRPISLLPILSFILGWSTHLMCGELPLTRPFWIEWSQRFFVSSTALLLLTISLLLVSAVMLQPFLSFTAFFMLTALLNLLTACLPSSCGPAALDFLMMLTPTLSKSLMQESTSSSSPSTGRLWSRLPLSVFPTAYDLDSFKRGVSTCLSFGN